MQLCPIENILLPLNTCSMLCSSAWMQSAMSWMQAGVRPQRLLHGLRVCKSVKAQLPSCRGEVCPGGAIGHQRGGRPGGPPVSPLQFRIQGGAEALHTRANSPCLHGEPAALKRSPAGHADPGGIRGQAAGALGLQEDSHVVLGVEVPEARAVAFKFPQG